MKKTTILSMILTTALFTIKLSAQPDLVPELVSLSSNVVQPGESIAVVTKVHNIGDDDANGSYACFNSYSLNLNDCDYISYLPAGAYSEEVNTINIPLGLDNGVYTVYYIADYYDDVSELDEYNNEISFEITVTSLTGYCEPQMNCNDGSYIDNLYLEGFSHENTGCNGFGDFTNITIDLFFDSYSYFTGIVGNSDMYLSMWIDYNDDYIFELDEMEIINEPLFSAGNFEESFYTSYDISDTGYHRMRVRVNHDTDCYDPCEEVSNGEIHDYTVHIRSYNSTDPYEPNDDYSQAFNIGDNSSFNSYNTILAAGEEDWFRFNYGNDIYYFTVAGYSSSSEGPYGLDFNRMDDYIEIQTVQTIGNVDTYLYLYDENLNLLDYDDDGGSGMYSFIDYILDPISVNTLDKQNNIQVYPNPIKTKAKIILPGKYKDINMMLYNAMGQEVKRMQYNYINTFILDISGLANDVYYLKIQTPSAVFNKKIIVN